MGDGIPQTERYRIVVAVLLGRVIGVLGADEQAKGMYTVNGMYSWRGLKSW